MKMKLGICDDEAVVHHQVKEYIEGIDFGVSLELVDFYNGKELLESTSQIDMLLLDICMPELDGIEIGRKLKGNLNIGKIEFSHSTLHNRFRFIFSPILFG